jgi:predicted DNA-binding transcriptional regulator YafY
MLQSHRVITAEKLAARFETSVRTIYRDISALSEAGVPILSEAGVGYSLMRGYHLPPVMFSESEVASLFMTHQLVEQFGDESLQKMLSSALLKIRSTLPEGHKEYIQQLDRSVHISKGRQSYQDESSLIPIQEAVVRRLCMQIIYNAGGLGEHTTRTIEPLGLLFYGSQWHLIAWCRLRADFRDFRIDRIHHWEVLSEKFTGHTDFSVSSFIECELSQEELTPVTFTCQRWALERCLQNLPAQVSSHEEIDGENYRIECPA